jgi:3'(2'), 5'-bisphosphate nucleotidase
MAFVMRGMTLLEELIPIAREAGAAILEVYATDFGVLRKGDASPVTEADERAEAIILERLAKLTPDIPIVSEEAASRGSIPATGRSFWLVDPLDGTKEFINRNGEFTVNIALIDGGAPVLGVVLAPALNCLYAGGGGARAYREDSERRRNIACAPARPEGLSVVSSRSHGDAYALERFVSGKRVTSCVSAGSSLKFCLVATGQADLYPRFGRTMEWDTAAGHAILLAAGGKVTDLAAKPLSYGKPGFENPSFVATADWW